MDYARTKARDITRQKMLKNKKLKRTEVGRFNNYNAVINLTELNFRTAFKLKRKSILLLM